MNFDTAKSGEEENLTTLHITISKFLLKLEAERGGSGSWGGVLEVVSLNEEGV